MPEINMEKIDGTYHLWVNGEFCGVYDDLAEVSKVFLKDVIPLVKEELENERSNHKSTD